VSDVDSLGGVETMTLVVTGGTLTCGRHHGRWLAHGTNTVTVTGTLRRSTPCSHRRHSTVSYIDATDHAVGERDSDAIDQRQRPRRRGSADRQRHGDHQHRVGERRAGAGCSFRLAEYTENQAATAIDTAITVSDVDSTNLAGATAQITGNSCPDKTCSASPTKRHRRQL